MARRRRWWRWVLIGAGGLVVVLVLVAVLLPLLVPRDRLRTLAEERLRAQTGGEVSLGELSLQVFPRLQLVLGPSNLAVSDSGLTGAGLAPGPLVTAEVAVDRLAVDLALWPLLRRELEFGNVTVEAPRIDVVTAAPAAEAPDASPPGGAPAGEEPTAGAAPAFGLYLASVAVRDGELAWRQEGTGRAVEIRGWRQDLSAPQLGVLARRLQRVGGADLPADDLAGPATLELRTHLEEVALTGPGAALSPLRDLALSAELSVAPEARRARFTIEELSLPGWQLRTSGDADATQLRLTSLSLSGPDGAVELSGQSQFALPPATGPLQLDLSGAVDLARLEALAAPHLPARGQDAPPWPRLTGALTVTLQADVPQLPSLADAAALQAAWEQGLPGRVDLRVTGGPLGVDPPGTADPLTVGNLTVASDLSRADGRTRLSLAGLDHPVVRGEAAAELVLPPASGPLTATSELRVDLAGLLDVAGPYLPPRAADAPPRPQVRGMVDVILDAELDRVPALPDTAAWLAAWRQGLPGRADLRIHGGPVTVTAPALGTPLELATVAVRGDLTAAGARSRLEVRGVDHPVLRGDAVAEVVPAGADGAVQLDVQLPRLDLDALSELARQAQAGSSEQARAAAPRRAWTLVPAARAADPPDTAPAGGTDDARALPVGELIPPDLAADVDGTAESLVFLQTAYRDVRLQGELRQRVITVGDFRARLGTGTVRGQATVDYAADPAGRARWQAVVQQAPASELLAPYLPLLADVWAGSLSADVTGGCTLADPQAILATLDLTADVQGSDGSIDLRQKLGGVSQYLGDRQDLLRVVYDAVRQHVEVREGEVVIEGLRIDGRDTDWTGEGTVGLDGALDLDLHVRLPAGFTPDLGDASFVAEALRDEQGRIGLDFSLTGPSTAPKVALDLDPQQLLESESLQDRLQDEVKKGLGGLLDRLKGR
jgi:uncharacterized protein involved in outer membrane biogenesis